MTDINIKARKIAAEWQGIGVEGDNGVEQYRFIIDRLTGNGADLYEGIATAIFRLPDGTEGFAKLDMDLVDEKHIGLMWEIGSEVTQQPGTVLVSIRISGLEERLWHSEIGRFTVARTLSQPSSQPTRLMARKAQARIADPSQENPITVVERTIMIPAELQTIAVQNDENSEEVTIVLPRYFDGFDLAEHSIYLRTVNDGGRDDILFTENNKSVVANEIHLNWMLKPPQTSYNGRLSIQLVVKGEDFQWASASASITIIPLIDGDPVIPNAPSMYDQWIEELDELRTVALAGIAQAKTEAVQQISTAGDQAAASIVGAVADVNAAKDQAIQDIDSAKADAKDEIVTEVSKNFLPVTGGALTGPVTAPTPTGDSSDKQLTNVEYVKNHVPDLSGYVAKTGTQVVTGDLRIPAPATADSAVNREYADGKLDKTGGTMEGLIVSKYGSNENNPAISIQTNGNPGGWNTPPIEFKNGSNIGDTFWLRFAKASNTDGLIVPSKLKDGLPDVNSRFRYTHGDTPIEGTDLTPKDYSDAVPYQYAKAAGFRYSENIFKKNLKFEPFIIDRNLSATTTNGYCKIATCKFAIGSVVSASLLVISGWVREYTSTTTFTLKIAGRAANNVVDFQGTGYTPNFNTCNLVLVKNSDNFYELYFEKTSIDTKYTNIYLEMTYGSSEAWDFDTSNIGSFTPGTIPGTKVWDLKTAWGTTSRTQVIKEDVCADNAGAHNAIYRGKNLGTSVTAAQYAAIADGTFKDLFIGDYWVIDGVRWYIAHIDYYKNVRAKKIHHLLIVPGNTIGSAQMNSTATTINGYWGSIMKYTNILPALKKIKGIFGNYIMPHDIIMPAKSDSNGQVTKEEWVTVSIGALMNAYMVFGFNPQYIRNNDPVKSTICESGQLALFRYSIEQLWIGAAWWLRDISSGTNFVNVHDSNCVSTDLANIHSGIRPYFCLAGTPQTQTAANSIPTAAPSLEISSEKEEEITV